MLYYKENKPHSGHSNSSGRKSRNLREATYHLREEALRRYRLKHAGDDPPVDWEPSTAEQDDIIRALSPPGGEADPELLAAQSDGAFVGLGTPRGSVQGTPLQTPRQGDRQHSSLTTPSIQISAEHTMLQSDGVGRLRSATQAGVSRKGRPWMVSGACLINTTHKYLWFQLVSTNDTTYASVSILRNLSLLNL